MFDPTLEDLVDAGPSDEKLTPVYRRPKIQAAILPGRSHCQKENLLYQLAILYYIVDGRPLENQPLPHLNIRHQSINRSIN